jgi:hypothetical protein
MARDKSQEVLAEALKTTAEQTVKIGGALLLQSLLAGAATPAAAVLAAIAKSLVGSLFEKTSAIEAKINRLISEPFETARNTLKDVFSAQVNSEEAMREVNRQLQKAFDDLRKAYTYAEDNDPEHRLLIRLYQAMVSSLLEGGQPFTDLYLKDFARLIEAALERDRQATARVEELRQHPGYAADYASASKFSFNARDVSSGPHFQALLAGQRREQEIKEQSAIARQSRQDAQELATFSALITELAANRRLILESDKSV